MSNLPPSFGDPNGLSQPPGFGGPGSPPPPPAKGRRGKKADRPAPSAKDKAPTRRVVGTNRLLALAAMVVVIVLIGGYVYMGSQGKYVAVASSAVPSLSQLNAGDVTAIKVPAAALEQGAFTASSADAAIKAALKAAGNQRTTLPLNKGAQLVRSDFSNAITTNGQKVSSNQRLVSVPASVANAVGGSLQVGDRVDVVATAPNQTGASTGNIIAANVVIVGIRASVDQYSNVANQQTSGQRTQSPSELLPVHPVPGIYVLLANTQDAVTISAAEGSGDTISLLYAPASASSTSTATPGP